MNRWIWFCPFVRPFMLVCLLLLGTVAVTPVSATNIGGDKFEMFKVPTVPGDIKLGGADGKMISLTDFLGKVVILNFWRKDCHYCVLEKEYLKDFLKKFNTADIEVVSVDLWDDPTWVRNYGAKSGSQIRFATRIPGKKAFIENVVRGRLMGYYVVNEANEAIFEIKGFPSTYILDKNGRVVAGHSGLVNWMSPSIQDNLNVLLKPGASKTNVVDPIDNGISWLNELMTLPREINVSLLR